MKICDSAPPLLVEVWKNRDAPLEMPPIERFSGPFKQHISIPIINDSIREGAIQALERLISDPRMERVWTNLQRRATGMGLVEEGITLFLIVQIGLHGWRVSPKKTGAERRAAMQDVRRRASKLSASVCASQCESDLSVSSLLSDEDLLRFWKNFSFLPKNLDEKQAVVWLREVAFTSMPSLEKLLEALVRRTEILEQEPAEVSQPNSDGAEVHFFVRQLSVHMRAAYQLPLHEAVSTIASVVFGRDIGKDAVRMLTKNIPQDEFEKLRLKVMNIGAAYSPIQD